MSLSASNTFFRTPHPAPFWLSAFLLCVSIHHSGTLHAQHKIALVEAQQFSSQPAKSIEAAIQQHLETASIHSEYKDVILSFYKSRQFQPRWITNSTINSRGQALVATFETAHFYGLNPNAYTIGTMPNSANFEIQAKFEVSITVSALNYARNAMQGAVLPHKVNPLITPTRPKLHPEDALKTLFELEQPASALRLYHPPHEGFRRLQTVLQKLYSEQKFSTHENDDDILTASTRLRSAPSKNTSQNLISDITANMERWRWLPRNLGQNYVWVNIPSYIVQIKSLDEVTFETRTVVGKPNTPTPVFSEAMTHIVVNPSWHVPHSIAKKEMLPALQKDASALSRKGIQIVSLNNGRIIDPSTVDWSNTNPSRLPFAFRQPPSERNALGKIKFLFPNQHAVYLHDTPMKSFFDHTRRTYSHGCVRVQEPLRFADAIFSGDQDWNGEKISRMFGSAERRIDLKTPLPVHIVYFTIEADEMGNLRELEDPYGYHRALKNLL